MYILQVHVHIASTCTNCKYMYVDKIDTASTYTGVELNVDGMPIHRTGKSRKLPFLSKNCHS